MTLTVAQISLSQAHVTITGAIATLHHVEKDGVRRSFLNVSFANEEGDPAYLAIGTPPRRGPIFARTAKEGELQIMLKPIKVLNGGAMPPAAEVVAMEGIRVGSLINLLTTAGFHEGHAQVAALTLAGLLSADTCSKLFASFTMLSVLELAHDKLSGQFAIVNEDMLVKRKARKAASVAEVVSDLKAVVTSTSEAIMEAAQAVKEFSEATADLDDDEMLLLGAG